MNQTAALTIIIIMLMMYAVDKMFSHLEKQKMQQTINELSSKLMAKDYREYTQYNRPVLVQDDKPQRKPMSWHDDPLIEEEEGAQ